MTEPTRRQALVAAAGLAAAPTRAADRPAWQAVVLAYLARLAKPDGGYGWEDQPRSHVTPTFAVVGSYWLLGAAVPDAAKVAVFVRDNHPGKLTRRGRLEQEIRTFEFQQIQTLVWLGADAGGFRDKVRGWTKPTAYMKQYERAGHPVFRGETAAFTCRELLGLPTNDLAPHYVAYLDSRRRANGSFNGTPAADGSDGHVMNTLWGLDALRVLDREKENAPQTADWLRACQLPNGGFTYQPKPAYAGVDDVAYTRAAVRSLAMLGAAPGDRAGCVRYLFSLFNADGGFGDRPGWTSNPAATYHALDALDALWALNDAPSSRPTVPAEPASPPADLKAFTIQVEAHGQGSPADAVELARSLRVHLWAAKNAKPGWAERAQTLADRDRVPVRFVAANEEYGTWVAFPGFGTYSHTSDILAPTTESAGPSLANVGVVSWPDFRAKRFDPLREGGGVLVWQFGENEELVRTLLDDSVERGGYGAVSTYHFGNPDFTNTSPYLMKYRGKIPFVALQDAHGPEPWWFADVTTGLRTVFLAMEPTWDGWLEALKRNWVVAVRRDALTRGELWTHAGSRAVRDAVMARGKDWQWWDNPTVARPMVSVVAVGPGDALEVGRPEKGTTVRVRCAWECTNHGVLVRPLAELVRLTVDGKAVTPELVTKPAAGGGQFADHYHVAHDTEPGDHTAEAVVRAVGGSAEFRRMIRFRIEG